MTNNKNIGQLAGEIGEQIIHQFIDSKISKIFTFPDPKTADGAQVADLLIWMNRVVILIEIKTRAEGTAPIQNWARNRIQEGVNQILLNYKRIQENEVINLHNEYYHSRLDCRGITQIIGVIILVHEERFFQNPSNIEPEIYNKSLPIHVFSWTDLRCMSKEIDTISDFIYYLQDRYEYILRSDIPICAELEALAYYKMNEYKFPIENVDFLTTSYWVDFQKTFAEEINARDSENLASGWLDNLERTFTQQRRLHNGLPLGLYFAWEVGSLRRRFRTIIGQKIESVQYWFREGNTSRKFAYLKPDTGNWLVFYFLRASARQIQMNLEQLVRLKQIFEVNENKFEYSIYGFGFQVSVLDPPQLMGLNTAIIYANEDIQAGQYTDEELKDAGRYWGNRQEIEIREFPDEL